MKRIAIYTILILFALAGRSTASYGQQVAFSGVRQSNDGQTLELAVTVTASGLDVSKAGGYRLVLSVADRDTKILLPAIKYLSGQRGIYESRREALFGNDAPAAYETYLKVKSGAVYTTDYTVSLPYYNWMDGAGFDYALYDYRRGGMVENGTICLIQQAGGAPDMEQIRTMTDYIAPEAGAVAQRDEKLAVYLAFPANDCTIHPSYGANAATLAQVDAFIGRHFTGSLRASDLYINGYGSPEGKYADNEKLVRSRTQALENYIAAQGVTREAAVRTAWVAEDWDGLVAAINADMNVPQRQAMLDAITAGLERDADTREWLLKTIDNRRPYNYLFENIYPSLRRIEIEAGYKRTEFSDSDIRRLAFTDPETLGVAGLYRASCMFAEESGEYRTILETAVRQYPDDVAANNNMAVYLLRQGDAKAAYAYLLKASSDPRAWVNAGVYYYMSGDMTTAREYFAKATAGGIEKGAANLRIINRKNKP